MVTTECRLTTVDNPYDPFTEFNSWFLYDVEKGYNSSALLARVLDSDPNISDENTPEEIETAIDQIIKNDFMNIYKKVKKSDTVKKDIVNF